MTIKRLPGSFYMMFVELLLFFNYFFVFVNLLYDMTKNGFYSSFYLINENDTIFLMKMTI